MAYSKVAIQHNQQDLENCFAVSRIILTVLKRPRFAQGGFEWKQVATVINSKHCAAVRGGVGGGQEPVSRVLLLVTISDKDLKGEKTALL